MNLVNNNLYLKICLILSIITLITSCDTNKEYQTTKELFRAMKAKNDGVWFQNFRFKQHTLRFDAAGVKTDSTVWIESVSYPYHFRIDRDITQGVYTIYKNDSTYNFRNDTLAVAINRPAVHLLFKGGLYFISLEEALEKLKKYNYDAATFRKDYFAGEPVYVVGKDDNQFWVHAEKFYCMRRVYTTPNNQKVDVVYEDFKPLDKGWVEQKVTFYMEGKKRLEEFYFDIKTTKKFEKMIYNTNENYKWYLNY